MLSTWTRSNAGATPAQETVGGREHRVMGLEKSFSLTESQRALVAVLASSMPTVGYEALLGYYADLLVGLDAGISEWMNRRREAALAAQTLLVQMRESRDFNGLLHAQQDWMLGAFRRFAADAAVSQSAMIFANHVTEVTERKIRQQYEESATVTRMEPRRDPARPTKPPIRVQSSRPT
jgi:hypothetical protein